MRARSTCNRRWALDCAESCAISHTQKKTASKQSVTDEIWNHPVCQKRITKGWMGGSVTTANGKLSQGCWLIEPIAIACGQSGDGVLLRVQFETLVGTTYQDASETISMLS